MLKQTTRFIIIQGVLLLLILVSSYLHLTNGEFDMKIMEIIRVLLGIGNNEMHELVIFDFRMPRIVLAIITGAGLGIAGVVLQGITKNELADPGILGINAGAGVGIISFMYFFQVMFSSFSLNGWVSIMLLPIFGFVGGIITAIFILFFATKNQQMDMQRLILTGIALNSGLGALSMYISLKLSPEDYEMAAIWTTGSIYNANWIYIWSSLPWLIILGFVIYRKAPILDYFQLQEDQMISIGIQTEKEKRLLLYSSVGLISACVSVSGSIGFIGLMAPHIARQLIGIKHRYVIPVSALIGATLVVLSDFIAKTIFSPSELPVGIVISIIGIPYFLYLLIRNKEG
ncbi:FecCD family ABC transporter permease [Oceanobacillus sp. 1P07AA]|uniref:FecCD family ABC transporter permease n=1 Tax=Oceanobacillus sp. 1P07AA TaxID=3132293 RepID=UPI0039A69E73